jgi:hypothetical protein
LIVGDGNLREFGRQLRRLGNDPDPGLRAFRAADNTANVIRINRNALRTLLAGTRHSKEDRHADCCGDE